MSGIELRVRVGMVFIARCGSVYQSKTFGQPSLYIYTFLLRMPVCVCVCVVRLFSSGYSKYLQTRRNEMFY